MLGWAELVRKAHPTWSQAQLIAQAKREFTKASIEMYVMTLEAAKRLRPKARWGFYNMCARKTGISPLLYAPALAPALALARTDAASAVCMDPCP